MTRHTLTITVYAEDRKAAREMAEDLAEAAFNEKPGTEVELEGFRRGYSASGKATRIEGDPPPLVVYMVDRDGRSPINMGPYASLESAKRALLRNAQDLADGHEVAYHETLADFPSHYTSGADETSRYYTAEYGTGGERPVTYDITATEIQP